MAVWSFGSTAFLDKIAKDLLSDELVKVYETFRLVIWFERFDG